MMPTTLLNHLWQSTVFAAAAGLLTLALRKNRAPVRYGLWFAASVKFLIPFSLLVTIGNHFEWRAAPVAARAQFISVIHEVSQPFAPAAPAPVSAKKASAVVSGPTILLMVWLCGFATVIFGWARQWWRVRRAMRAALPLDLKLPIRAMSSPERLEPGVFGIFRPVLLVPEGIVDQLTPAQWKAILAHELCHVRRRDNLTAAIHMAVEAIFWFHPLVWWIGKRLVDERERACDEEVLLAASDAAVYAEGILNVCKLYVESPLACVSGVTGSNLRKRIRAIMTERVAGELNFAKKLALAVAGIAALAAPIAVGILHAPRLLGQSGVQSPQPIVDRAIPIAPVKPPAAPRVLAQNQPRPAPESKPPAQDPAVPEPGLTDPPSSGAKVDLGTYVIGASDILRVNVFRDKDWIGLYQVRPNGTITVPTYGEVKAEGLTPRQLEKQLTEVLKEKLRDPVVTVEVSQKYTIAGLVKRPGAYSLTRPTTVFEAINQASFADTFSNQRDILILRGDQTFHFNYKDYLRGENRDQNFVLQNGDTIYVK
jgi:beta-lactamase regulating signal transducer with metallopeptidase domain/protein involved in polysaccharide export with SLBB domain